MRLMYRLIPVTVAALLVSGAATAFAQETAGQGAGQATPTPAAQANNDASHRAFVGTVAAQGTDIAKGVLVITPREGENTKVQLSSDVQVKTPGGPVAGTLAVGARVVVQADLGQDGKWVGTKVLVHPVKPSVSHVVGTVVSVDGQDATLVDANGARHIVRFPPGNAPKVGDLITAITKNDGDRGGPAHATGSVRSAEVRERLAKAKGEKQGAEAEKLAAAMERLDAQHARALERALEKAAEPAKAKIQAAMERVAAAKAQHEGEAAGERGPSAAEHPTGRPEQPGKSNPKGHDK